MRYADDVDALPGLHYELRPVSYEFLPLSNYLTEFVTSL